MCKIWMEQGGIKMSQFLSGTVTKVGHTKEYQYGTKFFMEINTTDHGLVKSMVEVNGFNDGNRTQPNVGDTVEIESRSFSNGWMSVTLKRHFAIINTVGTDAKQAEELFNKMEIIRRYIGDIKDADIGTNETHIKVWDSLNELENDFPVVISKAIEEPKVEEQPEEEKTTSDKKSLSDLINGFE